MRFWVGVWAFCLFVFQEMRSLSTTKSQQNTQQKERALRAEETEETEGGNINHVGKTEAESSLAQRLDTLGQKEQYESCQQMGPVGGSSNILQTKFSCRLSANRTPK